MRRTSLKPIEEEKEMPLVQHLTDLRRCILKAILSCFVGAVIVFMYADKVYYYMTEPLGVTELVYIAPAEGFLTFLRLAIYGGMILASPVILFQLLKFVLPGLYQAEKRILLLLIPAAILLMLGGLAFGYFVLLPIGLQYLLNFDTLQLKPMLSVQRYISFITNIMIVMALLFQLPLLTIGLVKLRVITPDFLRKHRKYAIVLSVVVGAVLTPPDVITQLLLAGPLLLLYEVSVWISYIVWWRKRKKESLMEDV